MNWMDVQVHVAETAGCDKLCEGTKEIGRPVEHLPHALFTEMLVSNCA